MAITMMTPTIAPMINPVLLDPLPDGNVYVGDFDGDSLYGFGKMTYSDGSWYDGFWRFNQKHGEGIEYNPKSLIRKRKVLYMDGIKIK